MEYLDTTKTGYKVIVLTPGEASPMQNHLGGEIAVDDENKRMYAWGVFVSIFGTDSIMAACNKYQPRGI